MAGTVPAPPRSMQASIDVAQSQSRAAPTSAIPDFSPHDVAPTTSSLSQLDNAIKDAWAKHCQKLKDYELIQFESNTENDLDFYLGKIQKACEKQQERSKATKVAEWARPLFQTLSMYMPAALGIAQSYPNPSCMILGGIVCVMQITSNFVRFQESMVKTLSYMARKADLTQRISKQVFDDDRELQLSLTNLYGDILDYCRSVYRLLVNSKGRERGSFRTMVTSLRKSPEARFGIITENFDANYDEFQERMKIYDRNERQVFQTTQLQQGTQQTQTLNRMVVANERLTDSIGSEARARRKNEKRMNAKEIVQKKRIVRQWVPSTDYAARYEQIDDIHLDGTGQWLLEHSIYKDWSSSEESATLWLTGNPGSGKSFLAGCAVRDLEWKKGSDVAIAYFFCRDVEKSREPSRLLGSLLQQLLHQVPGLENGVEDLYDSVADPTTQSPSWRSMREVLVNITSSFEKIYIVADGLDECEDQEKIVDLLVQIESFSFCTVKILAFSRPGHRALDKGFEHVDNRISVDEGENKGDIKLYIETLSANDTLNIGDDQALLEKVRSALLEQANGMFLYVFFMFQSLEEKTCPEEVEKALDNLPNGLSKVYDDRIAMLSQRLSKENHSLAFKIILYTHFSARPLSEGEMMEAVAIDPDMVHLRKKQIRPNARGIVALCANLIALNSDGCFVLCHGSLKDYLQDIKQPSPIFLIDKVASGFGPQDILADVCLTYLLLDNFEFSEEQIEVSVGAKVEGYPFLDYACAFWGHHARHSDNVDIRRKVLQLINSPARRQLCVSHLLSTSDPQQNIKVAGEINALHVLAALNLVEFTPLIENIDMLIWTGDSLGRKPADYAWVRFNKEILVWLLDTAQDLKIPNSSMSMEMSLMQISAIKGWTDILGRLLESIPDAAQLVDDGSVHEFLIMAAEGGHLETVQKLLEYKADAKFSNSEGKTALLAAVEQGHHDLWEPLLEAGADVNAQDLFGVTPFHQAVANKDLNGIQMLLEKKADVSIKAANLSNQTAMHFAAELDDAEIIEILHHKGLAIDSETPERWQPIHIAGNKGTLKSLETLVRLGADKHARTSEGCLALHHASQDGHIQILKYFIGDTPDQALLNVLCNDGWTPLHYASSAGHLQCVNYLLEKGAEVDIPSKKDDKSTALHLAVRGRHVAVARALLDAGSDPNLKGAAGSSVLHYAAHFGLHALLEQLLQQGANPNIPNDDGDIALHFCAREGHEDFAISLLREFLNLEVNHTNENGWNALHVAASKGLIRLTQELLRLGAHCVQNKNKNIDVGDLPMHIAAWNGHIEVVQLFVTEDNVNAAGRNGESMMLAASVNGHQSIVELLHEKGADLNLATNSGTFPLMEALLAGRPNIAEYLIEKGASVHATDAYDATPLHVAARRGFVDVARKLLSRNADALARDCQMLTPFALAVQSGQTEIFDLFLEHKIDGFHDSDCVGSTLFQRAAAAGDLRMLQFTSDIAPESLIAVDHLNENAMNWCASNGTFSAVVKLLELGVVPNLPSCLQHTPLWSASGRRHFRIVDRLLKAAGHGQVNLPSSIYGSTPLLEAAQYRAPKCVELLLDAGADPWIEDVYGSNTFDYARLSPEISKVLLCHYKDLPEPDVGQRQSTLRETVMKCLQRLLLDGDDEIKGKELYIRLSTLQVLSRAILFLGKYARPQDAITCFSELMQGTPADRYRFYFDCTFCRRENFSGDVFYCSTCGSTELCAKCHETFTQDEDRRLPSVVTAIRSLEKIMSPLAAAVQQYKPEAVFFLYGALYRFQSVADLLDEVKSEYKKLRDGQEADKHYSLIPCPGYDLLNLADDVKAVLRIDDIPTFETKAKELKTRFRKWQMQFKEQESSLHFSCQEHDFFQISEERCREIRKDSKIFANERRITKNWLRLALLHYGSLPNNPDFKRAPSASAIKRADTFPASATRTSKPPQPDISIKPLIRSRSPRTLLDSEPAPQDRAAGEERTLLARTSTGSKPEETFIRQDSGQIDTTSVRRASAIASFTGFMQATITPMDEAGLASKTLSTPEARMKETLGSSFIVKPPVNGSIYSACSSGTITDSLVTEPESVTETPMVNDDMESRSMVDVTKRSQRVGTQVLLEEISATPASNIGINVWYVDIEDDDISEEPHKSASRYQISVLYNQDSWDEKIVSVALEFADAICPGFAKKYIELRRSVRDEERALKEALEREAEENARLEDERRRLPLKMGFNILFNVF